MNEDKKAIRIGNIYGDFGTGFAGNVWDENGISPSLMTMQGGGREPMIIEVEDDEKIHSTRQSGTGVIEAQDAK